MTGEGQPGHVSIKNKDGSKSWEKIVPIHGKSETNGDVNIDGLKNPVTPPPATVCTCHQNCFYPSHTFFCAVSCSLYLSEVILYFAFVRSSSLADSYDDYDRNMK